VKQLTASSLLLVLLWLAPSARVSLPLAGACPPSAACLSALYCACSVPCHKIPQPLHTALHRRASLPCTALPALAATRCCPVVDLRARLAFFSQCPDLLSVYLCGRTSRHYCLLSSRSTRSVCSICFYGSALTSLSVSCARLSLELSWFGHASTS
jgi:hypothetical protein